MRNPRNFARGGVCLLALVLAGALGGCGSKKPNDAKNAGESASAGATETWKTIAPAGGGFSILSPTVMEATVAHGETPAGPLDVHWFIAQDGIRQFALAYCDYNAEKIKAAGPDKILDDACLGAVRSMNGVILSQEAIAQGETPGREFRLAVPDGKHVAHTRLFLKGNRLYQVLVVAPKDGVDAPEVAKFLGSFTLTGN